MADPSPQFNMANILRAQQALLSGGSRSQADPAPRAGEPETESPEVLHWAQVFRRWWAWSAMAAFIVVGVTIAGEYYKPAVYTAQSKVLMTQSVVGGGLSEELGQRRIYLSASTVAKLADLPSTRRRIGDRLVKWRKSGGKAQAEAAETMPRIGAGEELLSPGELNSPAFVDSLARRVVASPDDEDISVIVRATVEGNPKLAIAIASAAGYALVEEYEERRSLSGGLKRVRSASERNQGQLAELDEEIRKLNIERMRKSVQGLPSDPTEKMRLFRELERELEIALANATETAKMLRDLEQTTIGKEAIDPAPPHLVARLIDLELTLENYGRRYTEEHPKMSKLREEITGVKEAIERYRGKFVTGGHTAHDAVAMDMIRTRARLAGLSARAERLQGKLDEIKKSFAEEPASAESAELNSKLRERRVAEELAFALGGQLLREHVLGTEEGDEGARRMEVIPAKGASPQRSSKVTIVLGIAIALGSAGATAFFLEHLDVTVRSAMDVRTVGGLSTIGVIPVFDSDEFIAPEEPRSVAAEAFSLLRNAVRYASREEPERCLMVTSAGPKEGKSYVSANLAVSFAQEGNSVVMVDADMRKGMEPLLTQAAPAMGSLDLGLASYLEGGVAIDQVIVPTSVPNLFVIPSGGAATNPASALRTELMSRLIEDLQARFNVVIVDTPPVLPVVDATLIASQVRGVLLVVRSGATRSGELTEAVSRLRHVESHMIGAVLNRATAANAGAAYAGYSSYSGYTG